LALEVEVKIKSTEELSQSVYFILYCIIPTIQKLKSRVGRDTGKL